MKIKQSITFNSHSKAETIINKSDIRHVFESIYTTIISNTFRKKLRLDYWSVIEHDTSISKNNPLARSTYIKLPKELDHPRTGLYPNVDDNECLKWSLVRYLNLADHYPVRTTNPEKDFAKNSNSKDLQFSVKIRDIQKIEKKNSISISVFG